MPSLLLGVTGGISAYKTIELASRMRKRGWGVQVLMTESATKFVAPLTFEAITARPVHANMWSSGEDFDFPASRGIGHIEIGKTADVFLIAPATANTLARLAAGLADDVVCATALAGHAPLVVAPAMNPRMWAHPATQENIETLRRRGVHLIPPGTGQMACGDEGIGRLPEPEELENWLLAFTSTKDTLKGVRVLVTAGGTREPLDPVRFLGNRSSGRMGHAIADAAARRGADVTLVTTQPSTAPVGVRLRSVNTALEMQAAVHSVFDEQDVVVMTAAVADYRPQQAATSKRKKDGETWRLELVPNPDILAELGQRKGKQFLIGFAAETENPERAAREKLLKKKADWIIGNDVSRLGVGFDSDMNHILIVEREGPVVEWPELPKRDLAEKIWDLFLQRTTR
ncbi:MAG: bifunctional phosphopantothenoylcysteine decarboxylase/phosphopantothenate--cysteine ligase CoaBC [Candidatus Sericytochromatia bacterium]|nr:bifunctional phosphopantothenoylcysteine decarboxylase/phosphopantothenate--cysteine ligase CoaBC [Candidatus Sericytochromatia bacterium]